MFTALPAELGLRLEATTGPVEVLVIEDVANPNKPDPLPLVVERAEVLPTDPVTGRSDRISVSVHNAAGKTIVAWGVRTQVTFADGKTNNGGVSTDGVEYRALAQGARRVLPPDGRSTIDLNTFPDKRTAEEVRDVTARATFVIFDDDTALGDERSIAHTFERRAVAHRTWPVMQKTFEDAMARSADPRDVLAAVDQALDAMTDKEVVSSLAYASVQRSVKNGLRFPRDLARVVKTTLQEIHVRREAVAAHHQRRLLR
jgi:hypothetical protein